MIVTPQAEIDKRMFHPRPNTHLKVIIAGITSLILTVGIARFAYTPLLPTMLNETHLSTLYGGWLATSNYIGYLLGVVLISYLNSLRYKYWFYRFNLLLAVISTFAMAYTQNIITWSVLRLLAGLSSTAGIILAAGFVMTWLKQHQLKGQLGIHFSGLGFGIAIPGLVIVWMNHHFNWADQWLILGAVALLFLIPSWFWMPKPEPLLTHHHNVAAAPSKKWMNLMIAAYFCAGFGYVISATFIVAILEAMPAMQGKGDWIWVLLGVAAIPSCVLWDNVATKYGEINALIISYLLLLMSIIIPLIDNNLVFNLIGAVLFGGTFAGIVSLMLMYVGHKFPVNPSKAMAKLTICYGIAQIIAPAISGYVSSFSHSYNGALWFASCSMLIGISLLCVIKKEESQVLSTH